MHQKSCTLSLPVEQVTDFCLFQPQTAHRLGANIMNADRPNRFRLCFIGAFGISLATLASGCSSSTKTSPSNSGGSTTLSGGGAGGISAQGGSTAPSGGTTVVSSSTIVGGITASGGIAPQGGSAASGGTTVVGGATALGGGGDAGVPDAPATQPDAPIGGSSGGGTGGTSGIGGEADAGGTTSGGGSSGAPPALSQDQATYESFTMAPNASYECYYSLPYTGIPVSGTNYFAQNSAQLTASPSTGTQKVTDTALVDIAKIPIPSGYAPDRYLVGGKIVVSSGPAWIRNVTYPAGVVEGISGGVRTDILDATGTTIVNSYINSGYSVVPLTGNVASSSFSDLVNYFSPLFYNTTPLLAPGATWAAGASYMKFTSTEIGDTYFVFDYSSIQAASGSTPKPVATGTTIAALMNAGGILVGSDSTTYTMALGSVSMINGVNTYVATDPRPSPRTTPSYITFYDLNGNVYLGEVIKDGTVAGGNPYAAPGAYPILTYTEEYQMRLNGAALTSFQNAVTF
jgi:hypothetical protein